MLNSVRFATALVLSGVLAGCATAPEAPVCPEGQQYLRTAQLFFGRNIDTPGVSDEAFRKFTDEELTPRFPDGLTILDGGGQWRGPENQMLRDASKIVLIVLPNEGDAMGKINAARSAYTSRFGQDAVLTITQATCVSF